MPHSSRQKKGIASPVKIYKSRGKTTDKVSYDDDLFGKTTFSSTTTFDDQEQVVPLRTHSITPQKPNPPPKAKTESIYKLSISQFVTVKVKQHLLQNELLPKIIICIFGFVIYVILHQTNALTTATSICHSNAMSEYNHILYRAISMFFEVFFTYSHVLLVSFTTYSFTKSIASMIASVISILLFSTVGHFVLHQLTSSSPYYKLKS